jgi:glycosyltransferase involved in cell wall biosynthesis
VNFKTSPNPLISIIMPTYNRADFILNSIRGVLNQSFEDFELIIVNDGSTDGTEGIIESVKDKRIRYFSQKNMGVAAARNLGLEKAQGKWISFCDSDDVYFRDRLERFLASAKDEDCLVYSGWIRFQKQKEKFLILNFVYGFEKEFDLDAYQQKNIFPASAVMIKRACLGKAERFDAALNYEEDWDLFLRVSDNFPIYQLRLPTFFYQVGTLKDPRKKHHLPDNVKKARTYIANKRIKELLPLYDQNKDSVIAKKIFLMCQNLADKTQKKEILLRLDSIKEFLDMHEIVKKNISDGFGAIQKRSDDQLISYMIKNLPLNFKVPEDIFKKEELFKIQQAFRKFFRLKSPPA